MATTRLHALDAIRGFALLLGLFVHGSMSFWPGLQDYGFPISDISKSTTLGMMFFVLHMFRMAVFFLIAGFFAHLSLHRKGPADFLKDRLNRIALPMIIGWGISLVMIIPVALWAASKLYGVDYLSALESAPQQDAPSSPLLIHFWFLYYLLWFYILAVALSVMLSKLDSRGRLMTMITSEVFSLCRYGVLVLITTGISAWVFYQREPWLYWAGIPTPTEAVWNEAPAFFIYGMAFSIGWLFDRERECFNILKNHWLAYLVIAILATLISMTRLDSSNMISTGYMTDVEKLNFAMWYSLASWCWIFGLVGAGMKFFDQENSTRRYLSDASYWIYLAHIPILFFLQTLFMDIPLHWTIKFPLILLIATPVLLWTYKHWVRYSFIGNVLNGPRQRPDNLGST